jgi:hypothetical protein
VGVPIGPGAGIRLNGSAPVLVRDWGGGGGCHRSRRGELPRRFQGSMWRLLRQRSGLRWRPTKEIPFQIKTCTISGARPGGWGCHRSRDSRLSWVLHHFWCRHGGGGPTRPETAKAPGFLREPMETVARLMGPGGDGGHGAAPRLGMTNHFKGRTFAVSHPLSAV